MSYNFTFANTPQLHFGSGRIGQLSSLTKTFGNRILLITGAKSFTLSPYYSSVIEQLQANSTTLESYVIDKEPTPEMIDRAVQRYADYNASVVVAIGGGSVLDAGKAISAMLPINEPIKTYLEGVGTKSHPGVKIPFVAVPTTAGTGSEATKNAVISEVGEHGFKKSLRHNRFVPEIAIIDPLLTISCPKQTTAASGMDAFTQLLESYLSTMANPVTDALALEGLKRISVSLLQAYHNGDDISARADMGLAAYLSGVTLANAGLGLVHGFASSVGGFYDIPHGVICSSLMTASNKLTLQKLRQAGRNEIALKKYAIVGKLFSSKEGSDEYYADLLIDTIASYSKEMEIPSLKISRADVQKIAAGTDNKYNPVSLSKDEIIEVLETSIR